jgi:ribosomal protein L24E
MELALGCPIPYWDSLLLLLKCNLFSPWYSWHIAHLALNKNHSLTYSKSHEILEYSSCPNKLRWKHLCNDKMFTSSNLRHRWPWHTNTWPLTRINTFGNTIEPPYFELGLSLFLSQNMSNIVRTVVSGLTLIRQNIGKPNNLKVFFTYSKSHEILEYSSCPNKLRWKHLCNDKMFTTK